MGNWTTWLAVSAAIFSLFSCGQSHPLSITLVHPKTQAVRKCSARESSPKDIPLLSGIVETCARQLEARGFVRVDAVTDDQRATPEGLKSLPPTNPAP